MIVVHHGLPMRHENVCLDLGTKSFFPRSWIPCSIVCRNYSCPQCFNCPWPLEEVEEFVYNTTHLSFTEDELIKQCSVVDMLVKYSTFYCLCFIAYYGGRRGRGQLHPTPLPPHTIPEFNCLCSFHYCHVFSFF